MGERALLVPSTGDGEGQAVDPGTRRRLAAIAALQRRGVAVESFIAELAALVDGAEGT